MRVIRLMLEGFAVVFGAAIIGIVGIILYIIAVAEFTGGNPFQ